MVNDNWTKDAAWVTWARRISDEADQSGLRVLVFPVAIDEAVIATGLVPDQAVRWDQWTAEPEVVKQRRLFTCLSYQFCRMLRHYLEHLNRPGMADDDLLAYLRRVEIFLSHSKHDSEGTEIALQFRQFIQDAGYDALFDAYDIPVGLRFNRVLLEKVRVSAVVAIHTDSYSTREWCRREMIEAKLFNVPLVVANCIRDVDERGFPYMANVPIVRMNPEEHNRIDVVVARLMDEVLKDFLWQCRVKLFVSACSNVSFIPRPPELIVLTTLKDRRPPIDTLVYPAPPHWSRGNEPFRLSSSRD